MKAMVALVLSCSALVMGSAQEGREESGSGTSHPAEISQIGQTGKRQAFVSDGYSWFQSGKVRVYFSADFARALDPIGDGTYYNEEFQERLGRLFRSGVLNGEMFCKQIGDLPPAVTNVSRANTDLRQQADVFRAMESYEGPLIKILRYEILSRSETHLETITYELWVTSSRAESGWGEFHKFRVTTKKRLLLGPKLVKFEYIGMQM